MTGEGVETVRTGVALPTRQTATLPPNEPVAKCVPSGLQAASVSWLCRGNACSNRPARL